MKNGEWGGGIRDKGRERRNEDEGLREGWLGEGKRDEGHTR